MNPKDIRIDIVLVVVAILAGSCKKLVDAPQPVNSITTEETFSTEATATSAVIAIYNDLIDGHGNGLAYGDGFTTFALGLSADELTYYDPTNGAIYPFQINQLLSNNSDINGSIWAPAFFDIYIANAVIEGAQASSSLTQATKNQLTGEAEFLRAYINFYLVNMFGGIPLVTTTDYTQTSTLPRASVTQIYGQIASDLESAQGLLPGDYSISQGQRYRANKWAATALLARVDLYLGNWAGADSAATAVLNNTGLYSLPPLGNDSVFAANSSEAILQLIPGATSQYATFEGYQEIPSPLNTGLAIYYLTPTLLNAFDSGDQRRVYWVDSTIYSGSTYYFPYKYQVKTSSGGNTPEYYMLLRLGEQYLIRAEARVQGGNNTTGAVADLNAIRIRAGLPAYTGPTDQASLLLAIVHERQIELFAEWGHRWLDLKRWGTAQSVLTTNKGFAVPQDQLLYPIPINELAVDPFLVQNPGY